jgi:hypothetical protein
MQLADAEAVRVIEETVTGLAMEFGALSSDERVAFRRAVTNLYRVGACIDSSSAAELKEDPDLRQECAIYLESMFSGGPFVFCALMNLRKVLGDAETQADLPSEDLPQLLREVSRLSPPERPALFVGAFLLSVRLYEELLTTAIL